MNHIATLRFAESIPFHSFTFPGYQSTLWAADLHGPVQAIGAWVDGQPVGLALSLWCPYEDLARIVTLFVAPAFRRQGVADLLLAATESGWRARGAKRLEVGYLQQSGAADTLSRMLARHAWPQAQPERLICACDRSMLDSKWFAREPVVPNGCDIISWSRVSVRERAALMAEQLLDPWIPTSLNPFKYEANAEFNSVALREAGKIVGWVITERYDVQTLVYSCSYMHPDRQKRGWIVPLYIEAVRRHATRSDLPNARWAVPYRFAPMVKFVQRWMASYATELQDYLVAIKNLE